MYVHSIRNLDADPGDINIELFGVSFLNLVRTCTAPSPKEKQVEKETHLVAAPVDNGE